MVLRICSVPPALAANVGVTRRWEHGFAVRGRINGPAAGPIKAIINWRDSGDHDPWEWLDSSDHEVARFRVSATLEAQARGEQALALYPQLA